MPEQAVQTIGAGDFPAIRKRILDNSLVAVQSRFPIENEQYTLSLENVGYQSIPDYTRADQKRALQTDSSLSARLRGRWVLTDKATGKVVSKSNLKGIMDVPWLTERGTFIRRGSEVTLPIQMRLVPGVYARLGEDGKAKAHINARQGTGNSVTMTMDPANPVFKLTVGTRNYKLYPLLKHLGAQDEDLMKMWGEDIYRSNYDDFVKGGGWYSKKQADDLIAEAMEELAPGETEQQVEEEAAIPAPVDGETEDPYDKIVKDVLGGQLDPLNTKATFGREFPVVDADLLRETSLRLLKVTRGELPPDNRDSLENQRFYAAPELIGERVRLDAGGLARNLLWKASRNGNVDKIPGGALTKYIGGLFTESNLAQVIEETNPLDAYARATKVTRMGEGGISSIDSAPMSARMVHNTYKGFIDPVSSPESLRVGLDTQIAIGAQLGSDGLAYTPMLDTNGKRVMVSSVEAAAVPIAFPEYRNSTDRVIPAMLGDRIEYVPKSQVKYFLPNGDSLFAMSSSLIPLKGGIKAGRLLMAQKHQTQAMPLPNRMAPYVQTLDPDGSGRSVEDHYSDILGSVRAPLGGTVISVTPDEVMVKPPEGPPVRYSLYNHHPLNRKTMVHNTPRVKPGDVLKPGQLIASSNYTDEKGTAALGTQLVTAWLAFKGHNYLDGIVISESAAKKLASEHLYRTAIDRDKETDYSRDAYVGAFPTKFNRDQIATLDPTGVVKKGVVLKKGDPMVLGLARRAPGPDTMFRPLAKDASEVWEHEFPGTVVDVVNDDRGIKVYAQAEVPAAVGDKLAARFANKGTIGLILPDSRMPRTQDGTVIDVAFSPTGIPSRVNSGAIVEAALGKVAAKTGKGYVLPGFMDESMAVFAKRELAKNGLTDREDLVDPDSGNIIPKIMVGNSYITKFHHTSESKGGARSTGGYTSDELPSMGGDNGAKSLGGLVLGAVVAHGSTGILQDLKTIKGQKNTDFWRDFKMGRTPAMPGTPLIYERFLAHLEGSGVHVNREGLDTNIFALTDRDVKQYARTALDNAQTYDSATMRPLKGGLFDPAIFGPEGNQWGRIDLDEPVPNPVMEDVIRGLLGLRAADLDSVLAGQRKLPNGLTGGAGLTAQLKSIDVDQAIKDNRNTILHGSSSKRNQAVKNYRWLSAMKQHGATPADFMLTSVPVLPPRFRRVSRSDGMDMIADANYLYKALMDAREDARMAAKSGLPDDMVGMGRLAVYNAFKAVTGLSEPADKQLQDKDINGLLTWVFGKGSPKCHDDNTDLLTEQGFVPIKDYDGSYPCAYAVPGKDGEQSLQFALPGKVIHARHVGEMIRITGEGMDALVTPNHRCYISYRQTAAIGQYQMVEARHLLEAGVPFYIRSAPEDAEFSIPQLVRPENMSLEKFDGMIHAVTVPTGITVIRRNGMISLTGNSGKFQRSVVGGNLDVAGRSVINADPELRMDQVGLPINQAWDLYRDFIIRRLVQNGANVLQATKEVVERNKRAEEVLQQVIKERPLILTRAPALHKYSVMAFWPQLVEGDTLKLNSVIQEPFNADNDGDSIQTMIGVKVTQRFLKKMLDKGKKGAKVMVVPPNQKESTMHSKSTLPSLAGITVSIEDIPVVEGTETILDEKRTEWDVPDGLYVDALDRSTGRPGIYPVTKKSLHRDVPMWDVQLGQNNNLPRIITCSEDRSLITYDGGKLVTSTPDESLGRMVPKVLPASSSSPDYCQRWAKWGVQIPLTRSTGELIGALIGDGWIAGNQTSYVSSSYPELQDFLIEASSRYFPCNSKSKVTTFEGKEGSRWGNPHSERVHFHFTTPVATALKAAIGSGAANKRIPWECLCGCRAHLEGLLAGLLETDGTFGYSVLKDGKINRVVAYDTTSPYLRDGITALCAKMGIRTSVFVYRGVHSTMDCYRISFSVADFAVFVRNSPRFRLHQNAKQEKMDKIIGGSTNTVADGKMDRVPYPVHLLGEIAWAKVSLVPTEKSRYAKAGDMPRGVATILAKELSAMDWTDYRQPGSIAAARRTNRTPEEARALVMEWCALVANVDLKWEKITKVNFRGREDAWDLTVPGPLTFATSDGFIVQDTMTYYVPVTDRAVRDATEKMLPSKNLLSARNFTAHYLPQEEIVLGSYLASRPGKGPVRRTFETRKEAVAAWRRGEIDLNDNIQITGE